MNLKIVLSIVSFLCIYCMPSYCMEQNIFSTDQVQILRQRMRENPDSFNAFAREIAHQLYQQNPNITRSQLMAFFRANGANRAAVLPLEIIKRIWQLIVGCPMEIAYDLVKPFPFSLQRRNLLLFDCNQKIARKTAKSIVVAELKDKYKTQ